MQTKPLQKHCTFKSPLQTEIKAPHFVMYVRDLLVDQFGERVVEEGGLQVITTLDLSMQEKAQQAVNDELKICMI